MRDKNLNQSDNELRELMKDLDLQEPSSQFVDQVMNTYAQERNRVKFQALKVPLYLMASLVLILMVGWVSSIADLITVGTELWGFELITVDFSGWYLMSILSLSLSLVLMVLLDMKSSRGVNLT